MTYRKHILRSLLLVLCLGTLGAEGSDQSEPLAGKTKLLRTVRFTDNILAEDRLILVPENRRESDSREISVHYIRIPAQVKTDLPPVVILPGGPGQSIICDQIAERIAKKHYNLYAEIAGYSKVREVIIINQRGVSGTPGNPALPKYWLAEPPNVSKPLSFDESAERLARGLRNQMKRCEELGFDLRGYNLSHLVDDVEAIRVAHGYDQFAFRGASFGSQWALAYLSRYPNAVDRLMLTGVEPVDYGYDSAAGIWNVLKRVEAEARQSDKVRLPEVGLVEAVKEIVTRLEAEPVRVRGYHPRKEYAVDILIGADDFRHYLLRPILDSQMHSRKMFGYLPKYVTEIYEKDYQYLASKIIDDRPETTRYGFLYSLVDNSIGISTARESKLKSEPARKWLGDINWFYTGTRSVCQSDPAITKLRQMTESPVPLLLVQGSLDLATPLENATDLLRYFPNGKLVKVTGGTHAATYHAASVDPKFLSYLTTFMNAPDPTNTLRELPEEIRLSELVFQDSESPSLFEYLTKETRK